MTAADFAQILIRIESDTKNITASKEDLAILHKSINELKFQYNELSKAQKKSFRESTELNKRFKENQEPSKRYAKETARLTKEQNDLSAAMVNCKLKTTELQNQYKKLIAVGKVPGGPIPKEPIDQTTMSLQQLIWKVIALIGMWHFFKASIGGVIKSFMEWEYTLANVYTLLDDMDTHLESLSIDLMAKYGFAIKDVNKALFDAISAMVPVGEATEFMSAASRLAIGGVTDLKTAVDGLTSIINTYNLSISEANRVADAFFRAQKFGKTTVQLLVDNIGRVAPIARAANVSYQEMLSTLAELTLGGLNTEESVTSLRQALNAMISPAQEAEKVLRELDVPIGISEVSAVGLRYALLKLTEAFEKAPDKFAEMIPNIRAFTGLAALTEERLIQLNIITEDVIYNWGKYSSLSMAVDKQMDTLQKRWDVLTGRIRANKLELVGGLSPALKYITSQWHIFGTVLTTIGGLLLASVFKLSMVRSAVTALTVAVRGAVSSIGGWVSILAGVGLGLLLFRKRSDELTDSTKYLSDALDEELSTLNELFRTATNFYDPSKQNERIAALRKLVELYPDYLQGMDLESAKLSELTRLQKELTDAITDKYQAEILGQKQMENTKTALDESSVATEQYIKNLQEFGYATSKDVQKKIRESLLGFASGRVSKSDVLDLLESYGIPIDLFGLVSEGNPPQTNAVKYFDFTIKKLEEIREQYKLSEESARAFFNQQNKVSTAPKNLKELETHRAFGAADISLLYQYLNKRKSVYEADTENYRKSLIAEEIILIQHLIDVKELEKKNNDDLAGINGDFAKIKAEENQKAYTREINSLALHYAEGNKTREQFEQESLEIAKKYSIANEQIVLDAAYQLAKKRAQIDSALNDKQKREIDEYKFYLKKDHDYIKALTDSENKEREEAIKKYYQDVEQMTREHFAELQNLQMQQYGVELNMMEDGMEKERLKLLYQMSLNVIKIEQNLDKDLENLKKHYENSDFDPFFSILNFTIYQTRRDELREAAYNLIQAYIDEFNLAAEKLGLQDKMNAVFLKFSYPTADKYTIQRKVEEIQNSYLKTRDGIIKDWKGVSEDLGGINEDQQDQLRNLILDLRTGAINEKEFMEKVGEIIKKDSYLYKQLSQTIKSEGVDTMEAFEDSKNKAFTVDDNMQEFRQYFIEMNSIFSEGAFGEGQAGIKNFVKNVRYQMRQLGIKFKTPEARRKFKQTGEATPDDFIPSPAYLVDEWEKAKIKIIDIVENLSNEILSVWADHDRRDFVRMREALADQNETEQELLRNKLDKGLLTEEQYKKRKEALDEKYRRREDAIKKQEFEREKTRAIAQIWIQAAIGMARLFATEYWVQALIDSAIIAAEAGALTAIVASQKYKKGGLFEIGGKKHSEGGTQFVGSDGSRFEAERGEILAIVNARDSAMLKTLSAINSVHGKSYFDKGGLFDKFADGGMLSREVLDAINTKSLVDAISKLTFVVYVEDVIDALHRNSAVKSKSTF